MTSMSDASDSITIPSKVFNPDAPIRKVRTLRLPSPQLHLFTTNDGVQLRLVRYRGGHKGPVVLSHAFGTSSLMYLLDTIETNVTEYLVAHGYDVWVLDYRASAGLPAAQKSFSIDDIALYDYPAAVQTVLKVTGAASVQVVAHCVGAMSLLMALCAGMQGVRSAVCSQLSAHPIVLPEIRFKAETHLPTILRAIKVDTMSPRQPLGDQLSTWTQTSHFDCIRLWLSFLKRNGVQIESPTRKLNQFIDAALKLIPSPEQCPSQVCQRILFIYGEPYKHDQLNTETHESIFEMFGVANMQTLKHMSQMVRAGRIVDAEGKNVYLPHFTRLAIPIAFIHGAENRQFLPETTRQTFQMLSEKNGKHLYSRYVIPRYGHLDCLIGKSAESDVFPLILDELEKGNRRGAVLS